MMETTVFVQTSETSQILSKIDFPSNEPQQQN